MLCPEETGGVVSEYQRSVHLWYYRMLSIWHMSVEFMVSLRVCSSLKCYSLFFLWYYTIVKT